MATLLLEGPRAPAAPPHVGTATLVLVVSPVVGADGHLRVVRQEVAAGQSLTDVLPPAHTWAQVIWNGGVVPAERQGLVVLQSGDEVWAIPRWGFPFVGGIIGGILLATVVSIGLTYLSYLLFPPQKHQIDRPEEHTFSFGGIQTATGPGNVVPIIYGRHRVGGQLLQASVEQALTVVATPGSFQQVTAITDPPRLNLLLALGEGPVDNIEWPSIELNGQPIANFQGVEIDQRFGTPDQTPMGQFGETRNTFADGRDLPDNSNNTDQQITYTTRQAVDAFILNVVFNQGLFNLTQKGEKETNSVNVAFRYAQQGTNAWTPWAVVQVAAERTAPVRLGLRVEGIATQFYDIGINVGGPRHRDELRSKWQPTLESVTEIQAGAHAYANTALLGLRAIATEALQGALPNITVIVRGRMVRVGSLEPAITWSDNPAWCTMDFMTSTRYGQGIPDGDIDLLAFSQWAAYNDEIVQDERRHTLNYVLDRDARAQSILMELMGGSRTILLKSQGLWTPRPTRNDPPVQLLSWATCSNLKVTYTRDPDRINVMEGRYANEADGYQQDVITWPYAEAWPPEMRKATVELRGITKPSRIVRALQFELNRRRFENVRLEMDCSLDAVVLQVHDLFRFSHPLPGWGVSGRLQDGSTTTDLYLDELVSFQPGLAYQIYVKHVTDFTEIRPVFNSGSAGTHHIQLLVPLQFQPLPRESVYAFGTSTPEGAVRTFRVTALKRNSDTTVHLEAVIHNPSITGEADATALPVTPGLFNPLGPPPPITHIVATELVRVQASGASLRAVNLSWDVGPLGPGYAPYGGATIYRRTILDNSQAGQNVAGTVDLAQEQNDANLNFAPIRFVRGHVLDLDDIDIIMGATYVYRVVPISQRDVPNFEGRGEVRIHIAGPTTPEYFPGDVPNLRLRGKAVGDVFWEGRDVHLVWDQAVSPLFNETFFVQDYIVHLWAPGQLYLMRGSVVTEREFTYTFEQNIEDQVKNGYQTARRDMEVYVWARTNTGRVSVTPAQLGIANPPPDMSMIIPDVDPLYQGLQVSWDQYAEPLDFDHYEVHVDVVNPPIAIYEDVSISFHGSGLNRRKVDVLNLVVGQLYYTFILPYDSFGPGLASHTNQGTPYGIDPGTVDTTPPGPVTNLVLTTGRDVAPDGTIVPWVEASWTPPPDSDLTGFQVHVFIGADLVPTVYTPKVGENRLRFAVPGGQLIRVRVLAHDAFDNLSVWSEFAEITSGADTVPPAAAANLTAVSDVKTIHLLWTPPPDRDYAYSIVWAASVNDFRFANPITTGLHSATHSNLPPSSSWWYWVQTVDTSGNGGPLHPANLAGGVPQTSDLLESTYIESLVADKITAGTISAIVSIGVAGRLFLDGVNDRILIYDFNNVPRVVAGNLGSLVDSWGIDLFNGLGQLMWDFNTGSSTVGVQDAAISGPKIQVAAIRAHHLVTDTAVITGTAQIANAIIRDGHILDLTADKIRTGHIIASEYIQIGQGPGFGVILDGRNKNVTIWNPDNVPQVALGHLGSEIYGLIVWNALGQVMWQFTTGATSAGISDLAITSAKIGFAAIQNAHIGDLVVDNAKIANLTVGTGKIQNNAITEQLQYDGINGVLSGFETTQAGITMPNLVPGDKVLLIGKATMHGGGFGGTVNVLRLRQDSAAGGLLDESFCSGSDASSTGTNDAVSVLAVYVESGFPTNKVFVMTGYGTGSIFNVLLVGIRLQK